jgi:hypothetical protein
MNDGYTPRPQEDEHSFQNDQNLEEAPLADNDYVDEEEGLAEPETNQPSFYHVALPKFVLMNLVTFSLYHVYWMYKNWKYVAETTGQPMRPFWRSLFSPFYIHALCKEILTEENEKKSGWITSIYLILVLGNRLPEPYDWISLFIFLPLWPLVTEINQINRYYQTKGLAYWRIRLRHVLVTLVGGFILFTAVAGNVLHWIPSTGVMSGDDLPTSQLRFIKGTGQCEDSEQIYYFYSGGFLSYEDDGNYFTDKRVVSYWKAGEQVMSEYAEYADIGNIVATYPENVLDDTIIEVTRMDESGFQLNVSTESDLDKVFVQSLVSFWNQYRNPSDEPDR